jgi:hypothetical protein
MSADGAGERENSRIGSADDEFLAEAEGSIYPGPSLAWT